MSHQSALAEIGIRLDAHTIRERLALTMRDADTLKQLLKVAERAERDNDAAQKREAAHAS